MDFLPMLVNALLADYYFISYQIGRGQKLDLLVSIPLGESLGELFSQIGIEFSAYEYTEDTRYLWLTFNDESAKSATDDYFNHVNLSRAQAMIVSADIYEGNPAPNAAISNWYLSEIERFFSKGSSEFVRIPCGQSDSAEPEREYMIYSREGMMGLYSESKVLQRA